MKKTVTAVSMAMFLFTGCLSSGLQKASCPGCPEALKGGDCEKYGFIVKICSNHGHTVKENMKKNLKS